MATPKIVEDAVTSLGEASLNKFIAGDGTKVQVKMLYASVVYSGTLVVSSTNDKCGMVTGDLFYNTGTHRVEVTLAGFTNPPHVQVTRLADVDNYDVAPLIVDNTQVDIVFYDPEDGSLLSPSDVDGHMNFNILVIGA